MIEAYKEPTVTEEIDGVAYTSTKFTCSRALKLLSRTVTILGAPGLQALIGLKAKSLAESMPRLVIEADKPRLVAAAVQLAYGVSEDADLPRALCSLTKCAELRPTRQPGSLDKAFDSHFAGELPHLFKVLGFILAHNFVGFTLGADSLIGSPGTDETLAETPSNLPTPSEASAPLTSTISSPP